MRVAKGRVLRPGRRPCGHVTVVLGASGSQHVHRLVLQAFVGPAPSRYECLHANGIPADNRLANLRWGPRSENNRDRVRQGSTYRLTVSDVEEIKRALQTPYLGLGTALARRYGVVPTVISNIKYGRSHTWVEVPEAQADAAKDMLISIMVDAPSWASGLPLACEASNMARYGK